MTVLAGTIPEPSAELARLYERIERGIAWLSEHDPQSAFHLWFEGRILPTSPMPAQSPEVKAAYTDYYRARVQWEQLWAAMVRLEKQEATP
jgi:hypothetical protein